MRKNFLRNITTQQRNKMKNTIILITNNGMGNADEQLQHTLLTKYLELLLHNDNLPAAICFYTAGVKLVCEGSPVIEQLHSLEQKGVRLIVCSTCLNYYGLNEKVKVGIVGGLGDIIEAQTKADKVITL
jgi:selenium metabolism protein YedF